MKKKDLNILQTKFKDILDEMFERILLIDEPETTTLLQSKFELLGNAIMDDIDESLDYAKEARKSDIIIDALIYERVAMKMMYYLHESRLHFPIKYYKEKIKPFLINHKYMEKDD